MQQTTDTSSQIVEALNLMQNKLYAKHWAEHSRASFIYSLVHTIEGLEKIRNLMTEEAQWLEKEGKNYTHVQEHARELQKLIELLERNNKLEQGRVQKAKEKGIEFLADDITNPELYSSLEQKVLSFVLKTRYFVERLSLAERKEKGDMTSSKSTKKVLELLEEKEKEIHDLRSKYENVRKASYMARIDDNTSHDIEKEINDLSRNIEGEQRTLEMQLENYRKMTEQIYNSYAQMNQKFRKIEELSTQLTEKTTELTIILKKERDYTKRIILDIENETIKLRNKYSHEILSIEEEKAKMNLHSKDDTQKKIDELKNTLEEKSELIKNLKEIISRNEKISPKKIQKIKRINFPRGNALHQNQ